MHEKLGMAVLGGMLVACDSAPTDDTRRPRPGPAQDADGDGYAWAGDGGGDCDDRDPAVHPGGEDRWYDGVDGNCDGADDYDADADGFRHEDWGGGDCRDHDPSVHPGATDVWYDGIDQDCDGADDRDADGDGVPRMSGSAGDCDDTDPTRFPGADEACGEGLDLDCDGLVGCEDADCIDGPPCVEDCSNGLDDDSNGVADCDDVACIGEPGCPAVEVTLHGGTLRHIRTRVMNSWYNTSYGSVAVRSLSGSVQVRTSAGPGTVSCAFSGVEANWFGFGHSFGANPWTQREPIPGCDLPGSLIVPRDLDWDHNDSIRAMQVTIGFPDPWFGATTTASDTPYRMTTVGSWFGRGVLRDRFFRSSGTSSGTQRSTHGWTYTILGRRHTLFE